MTNFPISAIRAELPFIKELFERGSLDRLLTAINKIYNPTFEDVRRECRGYTHDGTPFFEALVRFVETKVVITIPEV